MEYTNSSTNPPYKISNVNSGYKFYKMTHKILALIVIAWMSNGFFTYAMPIIPNYVRYGIYFLWLGLAILNNKKFIDKLIIQTWPLLYFLVYLLVLSIFVNEPYINLYMSAFTYFFIIYSIFLYYSNQKYSKFQKVMAGFLFLELVFIAGNTYFALKTDPLVSRFLAAGLDRAAELSTLSSFKGIGGYAFIYGLVPVILLLIYLSVSQPKRKFLTILIITGLITVLIQAGFTLSILFVFLYGISLLLSRFFKRFPIRKYPFIPIFFAIPLVFILSPGIIAPFLSKLALLSWIPEVVSIRLYELSHFFMGDVSIGTDLYSRLSLYSSSLEAFFNNAIAGISVPFNLGFMAGGHSAWLDTLAYFGLLSLPLFYFFLKVYLYTKKLIPERFVYFYNIYWLYFIFLGMINTLFFASIFTVWILFLPMVIIAFFNKEQQKNQETT